MSDAAAWLAAGGTVVAVAYALARDTVREYYRRPKLMMYVPGDRDIPAVAQQFYSAIGKDLQTVERDHISLYFRLPVVNRGRFYPARNVQVLVNHVTRLDTPLSGVVPVRALKWADEETSAIDIPAGVTRYIDVLRLRLPDRGPPSLAWLFFPFDENAEKGVGGDLRDQLSAGARYLCELAIAPQGGRATFVEIYVDFLAGNWRTSHELHKYVRVRCANRDVKGARKHLRT